MEHVYIYGAKRTPLGVTNGIHKSVLPEVLMAQVLKALTLDMGIPPTKIEECLLGNSVGPMGNMARLSWLTAGLPLENTATTIDFQCGGSLKAVELCHSLVASGMKDLVIAGGLESTSLEPDRFYHQRDPRRAHTPGRLPRAQFAPTFLGDVDMLVGAENTARRFGFTREMLDGYALLSHQRALAAQARGAFRDMVIGADMATEDGGSPLSGTGDEGLRPSMSARLLARAKPLLGKEGLTTPGNACLMHDGAAGVVMGNRQAGLAIGLLPMARLVAYASVGCDPQYSPLGPVYAVDKLLKSQNLTLKDIKTIEINEAFAAKILGFHHETGYPIEQININGGALAYGHPYGASGAIYLMHLIENLKDLGGGLGIITLGVAGGQGIACLIEV